MREAAAEVLAIGDELTHGFAIDTNSAHIARELEQLGFVMRAFTVVSDEPHAVCDAIRNACSRAEVVIATGGLGPTEDDRTRAAAAAAAGVELRFDADSWDRIARWFAGRGVQPPERNRVQAYLPESAEVLRNDWGTAPGFAMRIDGALLFSLPGVPREMKNMLSELVLPRLRAEFGDLGTTAFHELRLLGMAEAELGQGIAHLMPSDRNPNVGITAHSGLLTVRIAARAATIDDARALAERDAAEVRAQAGAHLLYEGSERIEERAGKLLIEKGMTLALAESCTGGMVAAELAGVPGISAVLLAGYVTYADMAKVRDLEVPASLLVAHGAVSVEVAASMAVGAARRTGARLGVAVTGIAGPSGGTPEKPVGTVCFGWCLDGHAESWRLRLPDLGRRFVRERSTIEVCAAILRRL
jgi:nicotinamide-nucleotide amidase